MSGALNTALNVANAVGTVFSLLTGGGYVTLDSVVFQAFEVPDKVEWGGVQAHVVHEFPGGARVVDTMGANEAEIRWRGTILGTGASIRAQQIDALRATGAQVALTWGEFSRTVVVTACQFTQGYERIEYSITCVVIPDQGQGVGGIAPTLLDQVNGDLASAASFTLGAAPAAAVTAAQTAAAPLAAISSGSAGTTALLGAANTASAQVQTALAGADTTLGGFATADGNLLPGIGSLAAATAAAQLDAGLAAARGYVLRAAVNTGNG